MLWDWASPGVSIKCLDCLLKWWLRPVLREEVAEHGADAMLH